MFVNRKYAEKRNETKVLNLPLIRGQSSLVGGGTGFIGSNLRRYLLSQDYKVTVVSRKAGPGQIEWSVLERQGIPSEVTSVVNLTGQNVLDPTRFWTSKFKQSVWDSRINSSENLVKAMVRSSPSNVKTYINIIGVSHYRPNINKVYTESDRVKGYDYMSNLCLNWEKAATLPCTAKKSIRSVKEKRIQNYKDKKSNWHSLFFQIRLRTGVVMGRGGGMIKSIWLPFYIGLGGPMGDGKQALPWIHIEDLCRLIQHCLENDKCKGAINAVAPGITTNGEFSKVRNGLYMYGQSLLKLLSAYLQTFAKGLGRPCFFSIPAFFVKLIFGEERSTLLLTGAKIRPESAINTGFEFKYPTVKQACDQIIKT